MPQQILQQRAGRGKEIKNVTASWAKPGGVTGVERFGPLGECSPDHQRALHALETSASQYLMYDTIKDIPVSVSDHTQLADDQVLLKRGHQGFEHRGLEQSRELPVLEARLTQKSSERTWLVMAIKSTSGRWVWYSELLMETAGRRFPETCEVKGKGTKTTQPNSKGIIDGVGFIVPHAGERTRGCLGQVLPNQPILTVVLQLVYEHRHLRQFLLREA